MPGSTGGLFKTSILSLNLFVIFLLKYAPFEFTNEYMHAFETLKKKLVFAPIIISSDWILLFELIYDVSDFTIRAVLGQ